MAVSGLCTSTDDFLKRCEQSGDAKNALLLKKPPISASKLTISRFRILSLSNKKDKTVAELGCGNGWISIAIAVEMVYGLDINPRAKISWINLYLNAWMTMANQYMMMKRKRARGIEFHESDLAYCKDNRIELERLSGAYCRFLIQPDAMSKLDY
ncbi:mitochondrial metal transporter [Datura stramonium]|uniref:Mitochondrial metal transporter n=1 Tax=Datura stramonium TaxID=4076 RepID=A0ABS8WLC5_DATST|nr:mitochondrial metal transporter [Datura stramonium]